MDADTKDPAAIGAMLRTQAQQLAMVFNSARDMMLLAKVEPGELFRVVSVNRPYLETIRAAGFPLSASELEGRTFAEVRALFGFDAETTAGIRARYEDVIRTGRPQEYDEITRTPSGIFHGRSTIAPIPDESGACAFVLYSSQDVTGRVRAEQALRESEEKFAKAFGASPDAISVHELESGRYVEVNEGFLRLFGLTRDEVVGRTPVDLGFWTDPEGRKEFVAKLRQDGRVRHFNVKVRVRDGRTRECQLSSELIEIGGRPHNVTVLHDITERLQAERAVLASEDKFARAFRASPDAISISELESGRILEVNEGFEKLSGYVRSEIIGRTADELGFWVEKDGRERLRSELERTGSVQNLQMRVQNRRGEQGDFLVSAETVGIGGQACLVIVSRDITGRLRAEQALRESEEKFAAAFRLSPDAMSIVTMDGFRYLEINQAHERIFGYGPAELVGRTAVEVGLVPEARSTAAGLEELQRTGRVRDFLFQARTRTGSERMILSSAERIRWATLDCALFISRDVTDSIRAEQALRESEEKFAKAFRSSPQALIITEIPGGRYIDVNNGFERITGYTREEIIGRTSLDIGIWDNLADRDELMGRMQRDGWARDVELVFRGRDRRRLVTRCSFELIELAGRKCLLSVIEDITEQRRAEQEKAVLEEQLRQTQKLEALGTLAGGIAHDFNNILTAIIVNQELAQMDLHEPAAVGRRLAEIGQASNRAKELVRQILTFSRQQQHERLRQHLQMIVAEALGLLRASLPASIEIVQDLAPETPPVFADAGQVHQVVMNLCTNAAHAMRARGGRLTVRLAPERLEEAAGPARPGLRPGRYTRLTVADTGHGMPPAVLARIFEPFFTTKGPGEGTGLGLPMVHGIMKEHEGGVFVHSVPGEGTTFDLYFPEAAGGGDEAPAEVPTIVPGHGEPVLVVDDEESISQAVGAMLRRIGYRVTAFNDPREALARLTENPAEFALLLTDRTMPHLSGPDLVARAHALRPGLPALVMSGHSSPDDPARPADRQDFELVPKPIDIADLARTVRRALDVPRA